ncbi:MAG: MurR/RpiR family transcriptional regulator [Oscillospiraceae bacterium]|nr:MurR/RpiR family transcriptional regulator [Oscillospiraceae bacterium]
MEQDLLTLMEENASKFSKGQRRIAAYIAEKYDKAAFMTALKLGQAVGVSESTVVRFASLLGYDGYPNLQRAMQEMIRNRLTAVQRIEVTEDQIGQEDVLTKVLGSDMEKIRKTLESVSPEEFESCVSAVTGARRVYILGIRSAAILARFLAFYLNLILPSKVHYINTASTSEMFEQMLRIGKEDVLIAVSFPRYSKRTVQGAMFAHKRGARVLAVSDSIRSPLIPHSDYKLLARSDMASFVDSLVAPMSLLNALVVAVGLRKRNEVSETFEELESIWNEYDVYDTGSER